MTRQYIDSEPRFSLRVSSTRPAGCLLVRPWVRSALVTVPEGGWAESKGKAWWVYYPDGRRRKVAGQEHIAVRAHSVLGHQTIQATAWFRRGAQIFRLRCVSANSPSKTGSNARRFRIRKLKPTWRVGSFLLSLGDLPSLTPQVFDLVNVPPAPLVRNALSGRFYQVSKTVMLQAGAALWTSRIIMTTIHLLPQTEKRAAANPYNLDPWPLYHQMRTLEALHDRPW
ncbi:MAG: hypothetical protein R2851_16880 [Caldilineaceae bacterium]